MEKKNARAKKKLNILGNGDDNDMRNFVGTQNLPKYYIFFQKKSTLSPH